MTRPPRRMLSALRRERAGREEIERLAREQEAVRRVATLVARAAAREEIFSRVARQLARLSRGGHRGGARVRARRRRERARLLARCRGARHRRRRVLVAGVVVAVSVLRTGRPARAARFPGPPWSLPDWLGHAGTRAGRESLVVVGGRLRGW